MGEVGNIVGIGAFWQNDKPGGVGFVLTEDHLPLIDRILEELEPWMEKYNAACNAIGVDGVAAKLIDQLAEMGAMDGEVSPGLVVIAVQNIFWLQHNGFIRPDEYNGVVFKQVRDPLPF